MNRESLEKLRADYQATAEEYQRKANEAHELALLNRGAAEAIAGLLANLPEEVKHE